MKINRSISCIVFSAIVVDSALAFDTIGNGYGSKWGADPVAGTGAIVTWGYMLDGTDVDPSFRIDPFGFPDISGVVGTSNISALRNLIDTNHGAGAFDAAIQRAFNTWSAAANITFVGPVLDSGLDVDSPNAVYPNIRIGAFEPDPNHWFKDAGAIGFGPPGPPNEVTQFPLSGDVFFNLARPAQQSPFHIAPGDEDVTPVDVFNFGDDLEGLFLHELGHAAIGLNHPTWDGEDPDRRVMYVGDFEDPNAPYCCTAINRQLHPDDIAAARYVYGVRGDYNHDRVVDAVDYVVWRDAMGQTSTGLLGMDGNADGVIDQDDHIAWSANFGLTSPATEGPLGTGAIAVPESTWLGQAVMFLGAAIHLLAVGARCERQRQRSSASDR